MAKESANPFFMYIAFNAPHDPRQAPKEYVEGKPVDCTPGSVSKNSGAGSYSSPGTRYSPTVGSGYKKTITKKEPEPASFGRNNDKRPSKKAIEVMVEKLNQIKDGNYDSKLPKTLAEDDAGTTDNVDEYDIYNNHYGGML